MGRWYVNIPPLVVKLVQIGFNDQKMCSTLLDHKGLTSLHLSPLIGSINALTTARRDWVEIVAKKGGVIVSVVPAATEWGWADCRQGKVNGKNQSVPPLLPR